ncbi:hypothetical protein BDW02DRAFT_455394, partial [Decorospora gaudefroyi]
MTEPLCGVCNTAPKKYKCPTCSLPYCSLSCFKTHKATHPETNTPAAPNPPAEPILLNPQLPPPPPRYLKGKTDFSVLATNPDFQALLKTHPTLLSSLQRVYAKTIQPDPEEETRRRRLERNAFRGRGSRGRGRGRGRGGNWGGEQREHKWTPKKGDQDAMAVLKEMRDGSERGEEKDGMAEFVRLVESIFGKKEKDGE